MSDNIKFAEDFAAAAEGSEVLKRQAIEALRDYFAGQALAGLLSYHETGGLKCETLAALSYEQADAMLAERSKKK